MRRKEKQIEDTELLTEILREATVCRIGMIDGDKPYIVPMNYGYSDGCLYFHSAKKGKKIDLLRNDNYVCFETETRLETVRGKDACKWGMKYLSVIGYGRVTFLEKKEDKVLGLNAIMEQNAPGEKWRYNERGLDKTLVLKLKIESMTGKKSGY